MRTIFQKMVPKGVCLMRYEGIVYRPPSEARSLILQLTIGCARNECTFCNMYKDKKFRIRDLDEVVEDMKMAKQYYMFDIDRVFLADGDALIVKTRDLLYIIDKIHEILPTVNRITAYGAPRDILAKTPEELKTLHLSLIHIFNIIGKTVDEAMPELDKYLDDAYLAHLNQVTIIHGRGTGKLRTAVHNKLKKSRYVKSYRLGTFGEGETGVTVVDFK